MKFYIEVINELGKFKGMDLEGSNEQYESVKSSLENVYSDMTFTLDIDDKTTMVMYSDMIKKSIFKIVSV